MIVGVPKEIKTDEYRVAMIPVGVEELTRAGHKVLIQAGAGQGSGIADDQYGVHGAEIVASTEEIWQRADLIVKVKEPLAAEWPLLRSGQIVFTYFHFAADEPLTRAVMQSGITAIAYETIKDVRGNLPLLTPMSEVAGRMSIQEGAKYLERPFEGRGILLGGVPGVLPANVVILGGGVVGANAAKVAAGLGANVAILDVNLDRLRYLDDVMPRNVTTLFSDRHNILDSLNRADLLIGAVLIPGARAPYLVRREDLKRMPPGAVLIDVAIDQGGCIETSKPTTHSKPTYIVDDVIHYCVTNMPGAVGRTSTYALTNVTLPYVLQLAKKGLDRASRENLALAQGVNIREGRVTNAAVAATFGFGVCRIMKSPLVALLMGSDSDLPTVKEACSVLSSFDVPFVVRVLSAHRTPHALVEYVRQAEQEGVRIFIAAAGGAAHLAGVVAAHTTRPVLGIPIQSSSLDGLDSLLSIVQMPAGVPVATMAIGNAGARNAGLFAVQILALADADLAEKLKHHRAEQVEQVRQKDLQVQKEFEISSQS